MMEKKELLSPRLAAVFSMIPPSETIADVGSDHGKLSAFCLLKGRCRRIIATDIHKLPAHRTRETLESLGLMEKSEVLVADGLTGVPLSVDMTVVIAGMGGLEICKILGSALRSDPGIPAGLCVILQPQRSLYEVRSFLSENGFVISDEKIAREKDHFYEVIRAEYTGKMQELSKEELFLGPVILRERPENYSEYIAHEEKVMKKRALGDPECAELLKKWESFL